MTRSEGISQELALPDPDALVGRQTSTQQVNLYIRRIVFDGVLHPGDRIPQEAIAQHLGLSRVPVRDALLQLTREGWVEIEPHRGAFVTTLDPEIVTDHFELYGHIYSLAAARAARRRTKDDLAHLTRLEKQLQSAQDPQTAWRANIAFQRDLVDIARSPRVHALLGCLADLVPGNFFELVPGALKLEKKGTARVLREVGRGDPEASGREYLELMTRQGELVLALFDSLGLLSARKGVPG